MKKIVALLLTVLLALALTSCVREVYEFEVTSSGGKVKQEQIITKEVYDTLISMGTDPSDFEADGGELTFYEKDNTEYVKITFTETFGTVDELSAYLSSLGASEYEDENTDIAAAFFEKIEIKVDKEKSTICISGKINEQEDVSAYSSCEIILNFSGEIIEYDIGEKSSPKTISIDMMDIWEESEPSTFTIKSKISSAPQAALPPGSIGNPMIDIIPIVGVLAIAAVSFVLIKKKSLNKVVGLEDSFEKQDEDPIDSSNT